MAPSLPHFCPSLLKCRFFKVAFRLFSPHDPESLYPAPLFQHWLLKSIAAVASICPTRIWLCEGRAFFGALLCPHLLEQFWPDTIQWVSESRSVVSDSLWPDGYTVHGILQPRILEWAAFPFSRGSSQPRDETQVSHIAGGFFTSWAAREAQEYWSGQPVPSPGDLPHPGIELGLLHYRRILYQLSYQGSPDTIQALHKHLLKEWPNIC